MRTHVRWNADRFYWAVLDTRRLAPRATRESLGYLFESKLPVPIDEVQAVYRRLGPGRVLACGLPREAIDSKAETEALVLSPESVPCFIDSPAVDPASLNLLVGPCEPRLVRRERRRWAVQVAIAIVLCAGVLALGIERRSQSARAQAARARTATDSAYAQVLPKGGTQPPAALLTAELRRLERTRRTPSQFADPAPRDVAPWLAEVLAAWPAGLHVSVTSIVATEEGVTLTAGVPDMATAEGLARSLDRLEMWTFRQPAVRQQRDGVSLTIRLKRSPPREEAS